MFAPAQTEDYLDVAKSVGPGAFSDEEQPVVSRRCTRCRGFRPVPPLAIAVVALLLAGLACFHAVGTSSGRDAQRQPVTPVISLDAEESPEGELATLAVAALGVARGDSNATSQSSAKTASNLLPNENLHDGNVCEENEEALAGLCYKKCSILTMNEAPIRTSPWTCCENHPCGLSNQRGSLGNTILCKGYDVDGSGSCPHKPGACLKNEEVFLGICYKRCDILTEDEYPNRVGPATCCKSNGLNCFDVFYHDKTSTGFAVGGGKGDQDKSTPALPHLPQVRFTEEKGGVARLSPKNATEGSLGADGLNMKPAFDLHDGNVCQDQEESFSGLCYKKCSLLTGGDNPIRTSPWTCCESHPCGFHNQKGTIGHEILCDGYDISADGSCPHAAGACLEDEELFMGMCYKKCSILTNGEFSNRVTPVSCCTDAGVDCFDITKVRNRLTYAVGGGKGDNDPSTPALIHAPQVSLTEATAHPPRRLLR